MSNFLSSLILNAVSSKPPCIILAERDSSSAAIPHFPCGDPWKISSAFPPQRHSISATAWNRLSDSSATNFDILAPTEYPDHNFTWIEENQKTMHALFRCIEHGDCAQNKPNASGYHLCFDFITPLQGGYIGGEAIWAHSVEKHGNSVLFVLNMESAVHLYHIFGNLVKIIIATPDPLLPFIDRARSAENPARSGRLSPRSFGKVRQSARTLNPEDYRGNNTYLGYSIEAQCSKYRSSLMPAAAASIRPRQEFAGGPKISPEDLPASIENVGPSGMAQAAFYDLLLRSVALVGVGNPKLSPTPYDALCLGVPFINPVKQWDKKDPNNRRETQHDLLRHLPSRMSTMYSWATARGL
ncbi:hypothetical protein B0H13DRAFT_2464634 [Mycena leptocephala]|nr:hypothetical protein B0H13DRAFT_2464634 [Mycena leptocephala]